MDYSIALINQFVIIINVGHKNIYIHNSCFSVFHPIKTHIIALDSFGIEIKHLKRSLTLKRDNIFGQILHMPFS